MVTFLILLLSVGKFGIGIGNYPNGFISFKFHYSPRSVLQLTVGTSGRYIYKGEWRTSLAVGGRALFEIEEGGNSVKYIHFWGVGAGIHSDTYYGASHNEVVGECFYEFELFPNPAELPLSLEIGIGLEITPRVMGFFIPLGIHFYFK